MRFIKLILFVSLLSFGYLSQGQDAVKSEKTAVPVKPVQSALPEKKAEAAKDDATAEAKPTLKPVLRNDINLIVGHKDRNYYVRVREIHNLKN